MKIFEHLPNFYEDASADQYPWKNPIESDFHISIYQDIYPVISGHLLFIPKYNTITVLNDAFFNAVMRGQDEVSKGNWDGYNIGLNIGQAAGQTCQWPHVHLIPRRKGDMDDPTGGVRHVIPDRGNYKKNPAAFLDAYEQTDRYYDPRN